MTSPRLALAALAALASASGCAVPAPVTPMAVLRHPAGARPSELLVVFLPGKGDRAVDFDEQGFDAAARAHHLGADLYDADAHWGYYVARTVVPRLDEDVIEPARATHRRIWLVGISAGGLAAMLYAEAHPGVVAGMVLLSPFLGDGPVLDEIARAGGLRAWKPGRIAPGDYERALWAWLKQTTGGAPGRPRLVLGYGSGDLFARPCDLLAAALPAKDVFTGRGFHIWSTWRSLWRRILDAGVIPPAEPALRSPTSVSRGSPPSAGRESTTALGPVRPGPAAAE